MTDSPEAAWCQPCPEHLLVLTLHYILKVNEGVIVVTYCTIWIENVLNYVKHQISWLR